MLLFAHSHIFHSSTASLISTFILSTSSHFFPFSLRLSPFTVLLFFFLYISLFTPLLTSVKLPLLTSQLFFSETLFTYTAFAHLTSLVFLISLLPHILYPCPFFLPPTSNIQFFSPQLSSLIAFFSPSFPGALLAITFTIFSTFYASLDFSIYLSLSFPSVPSGNLITLTCLLLHFHFLFNLFFPNHRSILSFTA